MWGAYVEPRANPTRQVVHPWRWRGEADGRKELRPARRRLRLLGENSDIGGLWNADMPDAAVYDTTHLVSSKRMSGFVGFPMTADPPGYPSQLEALEYLRAYAWAHLERNADVERANARIMPSVTLAPRNGIASRSNIAKRVGDGSGHMAILMKRSKVRSIAWM